MAYPQFQLLSVYSFGVYPVAVIGNDYKNVQVMALMDFDTVNRDIDMQPLAEQVYPLLPPGTPRNPREYPYVKLKMPSGSYTYLGLPWIITDTVELVTTTTIDVVITGRQPSDITVIHDALVANGITDFEISVRT